MCVYVCGGGGFRSIRILSLKYWTIVLILPGNHFVPLCSTVIMIINELKQRRRPKLIGKGWKTLTLNKKIKPHEFIINNVHTNCSYQRTAGNCPYQCTANCHDPCTAANFPYPCTTANCPYPCTSNYPYLSAAGNCPYACTANSPYPCSANCPYPCTAANCPYPYTAENCPYPCTAANCPYPYTAGNCLYPCTSVFTYSNIRKLSLPMYSWKLSLTYVQLETALTRVYLKLSLPIYNWKLSLTRYS